VTISPKKNKRDWRSSKTNLLNPTLNPPNLPKITRLPKILRWSQRWISDGNRSDSRRSEVSNDDE